MRASIAPPSNTSASAMRVRVCPRPSCRNSRRSLAATIPKTMAIKPGRHGQLPCQYEWNRPRLPPPAPRPVARRATGTVDQPARRPDGSENDGGVERGPQFQTRHCATGGQTPRTAAGRAGPRLFGRPTSTGNQAWQESTSAVVHGSPRASHAAHPSVGSATPVRISAYSATPLVGPAGGAPARRRPLKSLPPA